MYLDLHGFTPDDTTGARVMHLELASSCIACMFDDPQIPGVTVKNAAGRMPISASLRCVPQAG